MVTVEMDDGPRFGAQGVDRRLSIKAGVVLGLPASEEIFKYFAQASRVRVKPATVWRCITQICGFC